MEGNALTSHTNRQKAIIMNKTKKEIENTIAAYFHGVEHTSKVNMNGILADVEIGYTDFKTARQVRRELEDLVPNMVHCEICREYSDEVSCEAIEQVGNDYPTLFIKDEITGEYIETNISLLMESALFDKSFIRTNA